MRTCSKCETKNADSAAFCMQCGTSLSGETGSGTVEAREQSVAAAPTTARCPHCGTPAAGDAEFCPRCGKSLSGVEYGSFWIRLGGWVIDAIIIGAVSGVLSILGGNAASFLGLAIGLGYYVGLNAHGGTLGKRAVGLRLQSEKTGEDIGYGAALVRYLVAIASAVVLLLGYFWVIWDSKNQTWHDKAAGSVVVVSGRRSLTHDMEAHKRV